MRLFTELSASQSGHESRRRSTCREESNRVGVSLMKLCRMASWLRHLFLTRKFSGLFLPMTYLRGGSTCIGHRDLLLYLSQVSFESLYSICCLCDWLFGGQKVSCLHPGGVFGFIDQPYTLYWLTLSYLCLSNSGVLFDMRATRSSIDAEVLSQLVCNLTLWATSSMLVKVFSTTRLRILPAFAAPR